MSPQFLDELRARTLLSGVVGKAVKLQRAGREFKACCPFHQEKTPSFTVNDDKGFYHCFGCGAHGDAIRFLTDNGGLAFMDAVKELAAAAGMVVPAPDPRSAERAERAAGLHDVMAAAAKWFESELAGIGGGAARAYLKQRGLSDATVRDFGLGLAPEGRAKLKTALAHHGVERLVETGLLIAREDGDREPYDRFRDRLMFPIRDPRGRVIAFGGRILKQGEPKYLNSPETPLFDKGRTLYNLDRAAPASRQAKRIIVVEGYMDVIALAQAGIGEVVASSGTALTEGQLERLWRLDPEPILCFDGDAAGQRAAARAALRALPHVAPGQSLRFVTLPPGQDPDDLVRSGGREAFEALLAAPEPLVDRLWRHELHAQPLATPEARAGLRVRLREHARTIQDEDVREQYLGAFNTLVWDLFNPNRQSASLTRLNTAFQSYGGLPERLKVIARYGIDQATMIPSLIKGLIRYPDVVAPVAEVLAKIRIDAIRLRQTREIILIAALTHSDLESEQLRAILREDGQGVVLKAMDATSSDLAFSFLRRDADADQAKRDLIAVTDALAVGPELNAAVSSARDRWIMTHDDAIYTDYEGLLKLKRQADEALIFSNRPTTEPVTS